jgi:hypothetical protein
MALPVVTTAAGGLPVVVSTNGYGLPVDEAANGRGIAVTRVAAGKPGLPVSWVTGGAAAAAAFDPATASASVVLSNGNLTATHINTTDNSGVRVSVAKNTGKYFFEMKVAATPTVFDMLGLLDSTKTYTDLVTNVWFCVVAGVADGTVYSNSASTGKSLGPFVLNDILGLAVDLTTRRAWLRRNSGLWNNTAGADPATAVGGVTVGATASFAPVFGFSTGNGTAFTANFGGSAYAFPAPSGFVNWPTS